MVTVKSIRWDPERSKSLHTILRKAQLTAGEYKLKPRKTSVNSPEQKDLEARALKGGDLSDFCNGIFQRFN